MAVFVAQSLEKEASSLEARLSCAREDLHKADHVRESLDRLRDENEVGRLVYPNTGYLFVGTMSSFANTAHTNLPGHFCWVNAQPANVLTLIPSEFRSR